MPRECVLGGCSNMPKDGVSFHSFPSDETTRKLWIEVVHSTRMLWKGPTKHTVICSAHFTDDSFDQAYWLKTSMGMSTRKILVKGAVPSIIIRPQLKSIVERYKRVRDGEHPKGRKIVKYQVSESTVVCSRHFEEEDFKWTPNRRTLKVGSIPSLFDQSGVRIGREILIQQTNLILEVSTPSKKSATASSIEIGKRDNLMDSPVNKEEDMATASQNEDVPKLEKADIESCDIDKEDNTQSVEELKSNENSLTDESVQNEDCENMPNIEENDGESLMQCCENGQNTEALKTETNYNEVTVQLIDIPDDDDLFDFLNNSQSVKEDELKKTELYKYLTEENLMNQQMEEVTPYQSGDEDSEDSTSSDSEDSSSSEEDYDETEVEKAGIESNMEVVDTSIQEDSKKEVSKDVRRNPERKSNVKKPSSKKLSAAMAKKLSDRTLERLEQSKQVTNQWLKDLSIPENLTFSQPIKLNSEDLNQYLTCGLCKGYLYEASTITECMHTFCKNCIVRHCMEVSLHCPVCSILIHPTDPFVNIRLDRMIQDIVYKILPSVAETEMKRIEAFYAEHPEVQPKEIHNPLPIPKPKVSPKETKVPVPRIDTPSLVSLLLEAEEQYESQETLEKKFVRVTSCATVGSVCEFLKKKLSLQDKHAVDIFCCGDAMEETQCTLETIKQNFFGDQEDLMLLQYRIRET